MAESVSVTAESPLIQTTSSSVGGMVDVGRIESLPLNGRQFANAAVTIPGVMLGFHSDPTKSTQFSPQIGGGNGRNVNYQIDGGDNNDDTVGGLLQLFPLEAIQEFQFVTSRYKAEYGRSNGGVMNIVTKGGTNDYRGSWFTMFRDTAMNAMTETERRNDEANAAAGRAEVGKQDYRRYQYGGSFGGPIARDKAHFFAAFERTQQDTFQVVNTQGLFPEFDGPQADAVPREPVHRQVDVEHHADAVSGGALRAQQQLAALRRGAPLRAPNNWGQSTNEFNSINVNHNWVLGGGKLNEFIFQYADFANAITANSGDPQHTFHERRARRPEHQHAAGDAAGEVPVPQRLLVQQGGLGRRRPRLQGRRELHQRAAPVPDLHRGHERLRLHARGQYAERPADHGLDQRRPRRSERPAQAVRAVLPG